MIHGADYCVSHRLLNVVKLGFDAFLDGLIRRDGLEWERHKSGNPGMLTGEAWCLQSGWGPTVQQSAGWTVAPARQWACKTSSLDAHTCWQSVLFQFFLHPSPTLLKLNNILVEETSDCSSWELPAEAEVWKPRQVCCANHGSLVERMLKPVLILLVGQLHGKAQEEVKAGHLALPTVYMCGWAAGKHRGANPWQFCKTSVAPVTADSWDQLG